MVKRNKLTVERLLVGDDVAGLVEVLSVAGFQAERLVVVGLDAAGNVRVSHNCASIAEVVGMLELAKDEALRGE